MSAEVEIVFAEYPNALVIPSNACVESADGFVCWTKQASGIVRQPVELGDGNEMFMVVRDGLTLGNEVVLDPLTHLVEAQQEVAALVGRENDSQFRYEDL
jgi:multidrug efflux pump subunit AcrA (membrane-fusion protein)